MHRLFLAFPIPEATKAIFYDWSTKELSGLKGRVMPAESLHVTLMFFGERDDTQIEEIIDLARQIKLTQFRVRAIGLRKMGRSSLAAELQAPESVMENLADRMGRASKSFPATTPDAWDWFQQWENDPLNKLQKLLNNPELEKVRRRDKQGGDLQLHLTLFRGDFAEVPATSTRLPFDEFILDRLQLLESILNPGGSEYSVIAENSPS